jgi:murein DD-endopeptidase MepM/ murein hydrolase activator NlpD
MKTRRRTMFRDDVVAPWLTLAVIVGLWWLGAQALGPNTPDTEPTRAEERPIRDETAKPPAPVTPAADARADRPPEMVPTPADRATPGPAEPASPPVTVEGGDVGVLLSRRLAVPVAGIESSSLRSTFTQARGGGRVHEAMDILAPRGTPVVAVGDGRIAKLFTSAAGGLTIYQFDPEEQFCYYYAHLDSYAPNLAEGQTVTRGQIIGTVGTTGNAPPGTPHLHFAIYKLGADKKWWDGVPLDPFEVLR